ncbi:MAG TPA: efflux RND transporter periplasmic adaptor subunit [Gemmatimonadaceae bacterium]|nr:efflux RND transporter periplasmic adaptor subunit [Gemmatimonadaceae bacterium]
MMTRVKILGLAGGLAVLGGGAWFHQRADASEAPAYRTAALERGSVKATVSATGALSAVRTVQVGTQVSGQVAAIHADFNDRVRKGQLLARIDPTLQQQAVQDAQAQVERAEAQLAQTSAEYQRQKQLFDQKIVTASEFGTVEANWRVAQATTKSARVALDRARQNLSYTSIYSPIDGVIVERNVDVGQTVAASLSAPQLFLIANDLSEMQILASVDESDIGSIQEGQSVSFTVQSYAGRTFEGTVRQVRLQSKTQDNVVNYTAVVAVKNADGKLLPGMTATVSFVTGSADGALVVPNAALRFKPAAGAKVDSSKLAALGRQPSPSGQDAARGEGAATRPRAEGRGPTAGARPRAATGTLYTLVDGVLTPVRVRTGLTDGSKTVVTGRDLKEGTSIVVGGGATQAAQAAPSASPFTPQRSAGGPGPRF